MAWYVVKVDGVLNVYLKVPLLYHTASHLKQFVLAKLRQEI